MRQTLQHTLKSPVTFKGVGLHSGKPATMVLHPAAAGHGIWFKRTDIELGNGLIPAVYDMVERTPLCTRLVNEAGVSVSTVEHIMAALAGCGVHNALIEIDGPEVPIMDGSSVEFVRGIMSRGVRQQSASVLAYQVLKPVTVEREGARASLLPADSMEIEFHIDFEDAAIGRQSMVLDMRNGTFARELSDCRTFCRRADVEAMRENGLALGGTLDNAVVVQDDEILTPGGFRREDEAVRHKMLDALGDLYLAGGPILGRYVGEKSGHSMTNTLLRKLFETPGAVRPVLCTPEQAARLPGQGLALGEIPAVA
ncbi:UDP-3-O-[3-hydroxymyristoyl] N-acetylglucosamine deacetylase [Ruegeria marisrubri]|uniref:UDP-3-O-acyl-N-acetylglucosamine deacetylase n=1 Tax=Ruegeria marisrubri TaxID=1685379 RepID=A0A0X3TM51_9RHOB|nr:UDP-3-O-acyl-N-acetylglucosamine deacetylase [Ruegeria marisrubri]KUJ76828.1 UDP-3-O-[3-hydroxymyristoyl] N-acetylglucosamine deacetylase [Ruegeria marisrubri]